MEPRSPAELHLPVLLTAVQTHLRPGPGVHCLDLTLGMGGHSEAFLAAGARVTGVDRDPAARDLAAQRLTPYADQLQIIAGTFADTAEALAAEGAQFDAVLADLGVSSLQLDDADRGFSMRTEIALDMRMGDGCPETALELIDRLSELELAQIIWTWGEDRFGRRIAKAIKLARQERRLNTGVELAEVIRAAVPGHQPRHPAVRTFQALRIAVNGELDQLDRLLAVLPKLLAPGGRAALISFHSLEDRAVKHRLRDHVTAGLLGESSRKPVIADEAELAANPRSASAKLRWCLR